MARGKKSAGESSGPRLTPTAARNALGVAKVLGPAVLPVVTPYLVRAAATAREGFDRLRARRLGIDIADLGEYTGHGAALHARLVGADQSLAEFAPRTDADRQFVVRSRDTVARLATAVRAAERMPTARRRAAHRAISAELDPIEQQLLHRLIS